jgi:hypothetical protein
MKKKEIRPKTNNLNFGDVPKGQNERLKKMKQIPKPII